MDRTQLFERLGEEYDAGEPARRAVARQAGDLADSGRIAEELGYELTIEAVLSNLADAPAEYGLIERWNWWIGALDLSHGGFERFRVRPDVA